MDHGRSDAPGLSADTSNTHKEPAMYVSQTRGKQLCTHHHRGARTLCIDRGSHLRADLLPRRLHVQARRGLRSSLLAAAGGVGGHGAAKAAAAIGRAAAKQMIECSILYEGPEVVYCMYLSLAAAITRAKGWDRWVSQNPAL